MAGDNVQPAISETARGVAIRVKAVPGASRDQLAGMLGDRLKLSVSAPPEGGKANKAICALLADVLGVAKRDVAVASGHTRPQKTVEAAGISASIAIEKISRILSNS